MIFERKDPDKAYITNNLLLPKNGIAEKPIKTALTFIHGEEEVVNEFGELVETRPKELKLWNETRHHLVVPREFIPPDKYKVFDFEFVDLTPEYFPEADIEDKIKLRDDDQREAFEALSSHASGTLNLSCVAADTVLNLNRGGKGFKMTIGEVYKRYSKKGRYKWDLRTPTFVRAKVGDSIKLTRVRSVLYKGYRDTLTLTLKDGKSIRLTHDHEVLAATATKKGGKLTRFIPAGKLERGDHVITDGVAPVGRKPKLSYRRIGGFKHHPYSRYQSGSWIVEEYRAVLEAGLNGLELQDFRDRCRSGEVEGLKFLNPSEVHVHHKDGDVTNNSLENLEQLTKKAHLPHHQPGYGAFGNAPVAVEVAGIEPYGVEKVYDLVCDEPHNFVANGMVVHNCGKGKTVLALKLAAELGVPVLIVVNTSALLEQWKKEIEQHLGVESVGVIQGKIADWKHPVVVSMVHTLSQKRDLWSMKFRRHFGLVIYDEGHHMSAPMFVQSADLFFGRRFSLTATASRLDGLESIYQYNLGRVIYSNLEQELIPDTIFHRLNWVFDEKNAHLVNDAYGKKHMSKIRSYLGGLDWRNELIYEHALDDLEEERSILILSHSVEHIYTMVAELKYLGTDAGAITGRTPQEDRLSILEHCNPVVGTFQLAREGLDKPSLDTLSITTPFSSPNDLQQAVGRIQRRYEGKNDPRVRVYEDLAFTRCESSCRSIKRTLKKWGYPYTNKRLEVEQ